MLVYAGLCFLERGQKARSDKNKNNQTKNQQQVLANIVWYHLQLLREREVERREENKNFKRKLPKWDFYCAVKFKFRRFL